MYKFRFYLIIYKGKRKKYYLIKFINTFIVNIIVFSRLSKIFLIFSWIVIHSLYICLKPIDFSPKKLLMWNIR